MVSDDAEKITNKPHGPRTLETTPAQQKEKTKQRALGSGKSFTRNSSSRRAFNALDKWRIFISSASDEGITSSSVLRLDPSLVGSKISSDALCEESSVCEGAGYDEAFGFGDESEDFSPSSERETLAQSPYGDESYTEGGEEAEHGGEDEVEEGRKESGSDGDDVNVDGDDVDVDRDDGDGDEESSEGSSEGPGDNRPFILPEDWAVNKFLPMMSNKVFRELCAYYQIPDHISIRLPRENERC
ncbi:uncharacterized protein LOC115974107 [Quercus lobata]|uniref:uncharacterized protein LOC115974107 n=1 Tax=Quercus lobata TaxID=97700 RepID=UPI0012493A4B|nr:uncharacterized protein LOC115974107 [Quercus lobata]